MLEHKHLTDEDLLGVLRDENAEINQPEIETHISVCQHCQTRLMSIADQGWLNDFREYLSPQLMSSSTHESLSELVELTTSPDKPKFENEFESGAITQMLEKILEPPTHPETLGRLGRYEVEGIIGIGGMGAVLRGYDRELQRPVAIKMMLPGLANNGTAKQRFTREARAVAALLHPNVIAIHGVDETNDMPWFVMPLIAGPTLRELVNQAGTLPEREIARIGLQIASGLAAAHGQGLVHRDIKPENILVDNQVNRVVITDFGLARRNSEESITQTGVLAGTINFMSPEQTRGEDLDGRSDLFSLGALLFFLSTGDVPFRADNPAGIVHKVSVEPAADVRSINPDISKTMAGAIDKLLAKNPDHRFQSSAELEKFFEEFLCHLNRPTKYSAPKVKQFRAITKPKALAIGCLFVLVVATIWLLTSLWSSPKPTAESLWEDIQLKYQVGSPDEFPRDLGELGSDLSRFERSFQMVDDIQKAQINSEILQFESDLDRLEKHLDWE